MGTVVIVRLQLSAIARDLHSGSQPLNIALVMLIRAYQYAQDTKVDRWEFAIPVAEFRYAGVTISELRWLLYSGFAVHAREVIQRGGQGRKLMRLEIRTLPSDACFILSDHGVQSLESLMQGPPTKVKIQLPKALQSKGSHRSDSAPRITATQPVPLWNGTKLELIFQGLIVKAFRSIAPNQARILIAFQEEGWPHRIDDPLPPESEQDSRERLRNAIKQLNRNQDNHLLRFCGDGSGKGILWQSLV